MKRLKYIILSFVLTGLFEVTRVLVYNHKPMTTEEYLLVSFIIAWSWDGIND